MFRAAGPRLFLIALTVLSLLTILAPVANADLVSNDIVGSAGSRILTVARGATATVTYSVEGTNNDPAGDANGCNPAGTSATLVTSFASGTGASAGNVTFTGCGQPRSSVITVLPTATLGDRAAVFTMSGGKDGSKWNMTAAQFTLRVVDAVNRPPSLSLPAGVTVEATGPAGAAVTYTATASDTQDGALSPVCAPASGATFALGVTTVSCSVTDAGGLTASGDFPVTVRDTAAPAIAVTAPLSVEATSLAGAVVNYGAVASDVVDAAPTVGCAPASGGTLPLGPTTVNCTARDASGNISSTSFVVTVVDTGAPTLSATANTQVEADGPGGARVSFTVTATDTASTPTVSCSDGVNLPYPLSGAEFTGQFPIGVTSVICAATDGSGNRASGTFSIEVVDSAAPRLTMPTVGAVEATTPLGAVVTFAPTAADLVDGTVAVVCEPPSGSVFGVGTTDVSCSSTDSRGNTATAALSITVRDTTPPAFQGLPVSLEAEATSASGAALRYDITATDAASAPTVSCEDAGGEPVSPTGRTFPLGTTAVTCVATDGAGLTNTAMFDVTVVDTTAPETTVPEGLELEATGPAGAVGEFTVSARDVADPNPEIACDATSGDVFGLGATTVTCVATDASGNTSVPASFVVRVVDTTVPVVTAPDNAEAEATGPEGATVAYGDASASDLVDGDLAVRCLPASGSRFALGVTPVTCSATDAAGNTGESGFVVTVNDSTAPDVDAPEDAVAETTGPDGATVSYGDASASDTVDGQLPVTCTPASGGRFALGTTPVECTATDAHGNVGYAGLTVTVVDTTAPTVTAPADVVAEATGPGGAEVGYGAGSATDTVDGSSVPDCAPASGSTFALGSTTVTCTATDAAGNVGTGTFTVTVRDTTAPVVTAPADVTTEATGADGATASFVASTATDAVDGAPAANCDRASGSLFALGSTTVSCAATDAAGNAGSATFTVTVRDTSAPVLTVPADLATTAVGPSGAPVTFTATGADLVDGTVAAVCTPASGTTFPVGTTTVSCTATDSRGNSSAAGSFRVRVAWGWSGFLQPINNDGTSSFKLGSTVPVKFTLTGGAAGYGGLTVSLHAAKVSNGVAGSESEAVSSTPASSGSTFRWDPTGGQYVYNYGTKGLSEGTYQIRADLGDGVTRTVRFSLRR